MLEKLPGNPSTPTTQARLLLMLVVLLGALLAPLSSANAASLAVSTLTEGPAAGSDSVMLTTSGAWTATSNNNAWLHVSTASGTTGGPVTFSFDANTGASRTGTLTIDGATLTVTQAPSGYLASTLASQIVSGLNGPTGIATDATGNLYFSDTSNAAVKKWDAATGQVTTPVSSGLTNPYGIAVDSSGSIYIADRMGNAIKKWDGSTLTTLVSSGLNYPMGVAVDTAGNVYIADTNANQIKKWDVGTHVVSTVVSSGLSLPVGISFDFAGDLYIADAGNSAIKKWNATDGLTTVVSSGLNCPYAVVADPLGRLYIADTNGNTVKLWDGTSLSTLIPSGLNFPVGVAVDAAGTVYVSDTMHNAIKALPRAFLSTASIVMTAQAGSDQLPAVVPSSLALTGSYAPTSDQSWLTISGTNSGVVSYSYTGNTSTSSRTAHISLLGRSITLTQAGRYTPTFSGLSAPTITYGDGTTTISGTLNPNGGGTMIPSSEYVSVTINGVTQQAYLDINDHFSTTFDTHALHYRASGYTISYSYAGDSNFTSASTSRTLTVAKFASILDFSMTSSLVVGGTAAVTITMSSPLPNSEKLGFTFANAAGCTISGVTTIPNTATATATGVAVGPCNINASLSNNTGLTADYSVTVNQLSTSVEQGSQTIAFGTAPSLVVGGTGAVTATGGNSGNPVSFTSQTTGICTVAGTTVTGVTVGTCTIAADQAGNTNYLAATQVTQNITVGKGSQTISFGTAPSLVVRGTGNLSATASSSLAVSFTSQTTDICTVSGTTVSGIAPGTCTIAADQAGNANYLAATQVTQNITVGKPSSISGNAANGTGTIAASVANSGSNCGFATANFVAASSTPNLPPGVSFPYGLFDFVASSCTNAVTITLTYPQTLPANAAYWKYGPTPDNHTPHWYSIPVTVTGNQASFSISDGGLGDDDLTVNGSIVDQGGIGISTETAAVPTLSEWALFLLAGLIGAVAVLGLTSQRQGYRPK